VNFDETSIVVSYDAEADAAYIWLLPHNASDRIECTVDVDHGVLLDLDPNGHVVGIEVLGPSAAHRAREAASEAGRVAVNEYADALERLADQ
jgi:uncharacterized protein YuzE